LLPADVAGYVMNGAEIRTVHVVYDKSGKLDVTCGMYCFHLLQLTLPKSLTTAHFRYLQLQPTLSLRLCFVWDVQCSSL
jgi:hypothetical protein